VVTATVDIVEWHCVCLEFIVVSAKEDIVQSYCIGCVEFIVVTNTVYLCNGIVLGWSLLWLQQQ